MKIVTDGVAKSRHPFHIWRAPVPRAVSRLECLCVNAVVEIQQGLEVGTARPFGERCGLFVLVLLVALAEPFDSRVRNNIGLGFCIRVAHHCMIVLWNRHFSSFDVFVVDAEQ